MVKEEKKADFDLYKIKIDELIKVYGDIEQFLVFLEGKKIDVEQKEKK